MMANFSAETTMAIVDGAILGLIEGPHAPMTPQEFASLSDEQIDQFACGAMTVVGCGIQIGLSLDAVVETMIDPSAIFADYVHTASDGGVYDI